MQIGQREIGAGRSPYIIAEISGNHCGSLPTALELIRSAKRAGADAVKTQCYEPDTITLNVRKPDFIIQDGLWRGRTLYDLYSKAYTPFAWHKDLYQMAQDIGITIFSSVFDPSSIDLLERLGCPAYKIASFEIVDTPLIRLAAETKKPVIVSTGLATYSEIESANQICGEEAAFLHCTSEYPAKVENARLMEIVRLKSMMRNREIGVSDHTAGSIVPIAATALGASIIEKHLRLNGDTKSEDATFSMVENEFTAMVYQVRLAYDAMQDGETKQNPSRQFRRSLYAVDDIEVGDILTNKNVKSIRPGYGLPPSCLNKMLGTKSRQRYKKGDRIV